MKGKTLELFDSQDRRAAPGAKLERSAGDGALGTVQAQGRDRQRFLVVVTSYRGRLLDEDNLCEKYHVDCCRYAGLLPGDAAGQTRIQARQVKVGDKEDERTEIEITRLT